jgi:hypothetical protein
MRIGTSMSKYRLYFDTKACSFLLLYVIFQTSSYDLLLNIKIGGFSVRFTYMCISFFVVCTSIISRKVVIKKIGYKYFFVWSVFLVIFVVNTPLIGRNIGYLLWLFIHFIFSIVFSMVINNEEKLSITIRSYLFSFMLSSFGGLLQLILGIFGIDFFVAENQWWIPDKLPRINGFSYEPSYFATYLIIGFSLSYYLLRNKYEKHRLLVKLTCILSSTAILLSTSRMGIFVMLLEVFIYELYRQRNSFSSQLSFLFLFVSITLGSYNYISSNEDLGFLLSGLGINGGSAHSSIQRLDGFFTQIDILTKNPIKGYSLGGVSQAIAFEKGETNLSQETIKPYDNSINIFIEVLTASGIIGFFFFVIYIFKLVSKPWLLSQIVSRYSENDKTLLRAFVWSFLFELIILCFNQNILRAYFWLHVTMLNATYFVYVLKYRQSVI